MASEVAKYSVYDPRIVQTQPKYAVEKGALSISNVSFTSQTADLSSVQFNVQVPSENVFVDRAVRWTGTQVATIILTSSSVANLPAGTDLSGLVGPAAFPLHQSTSQMSATINDATVTVNTKDVLPQILRLADLSKSRSERTCPTMLDRYSQYPDSRVVKNTSLLTWDQTKASDEVPNAGFEGWSYCAADGTLLADGDVVGLCTYHKGVPTLTAALPTATAVTFYVRWTSTEMLVLPPFIFSDQDELSTGLFGVQNFQIQMNMAPTPVRSLRASLNTTFVDVAGTFGTFTAGVPAWVSPSTYGMFLGQPTLSVQFLTPALDIPLPPKSIVPWMEFPRYITSQAGAVASSNVLSTAGAVSLTSQTITLPNIPDLLVIYAKPSSYLVTDCDYVLPVSKISINFDNFSGLLSNHTQEELYKMSVDNGVDMDFSEWAGQGRVPLSVSTTGAGTTYRGGVLGLCGGPLVLRPGRDFALSSGQAPGLVGNFTLQFNLTVKNGTGATINPDIFVVPISSGFFETIKGSSRIIKGVLTEQDILGAPPTAPSSEMDRMVGDGRHHGGAMGGRHHGGAMGGRHHGGAMKAYM